jgi:voltage-gated potassium channel
MSPAIRRMIGAIGALATLTLAGALSFFSLGRGRWTFGDSLYMTITTISTVGFSELPHLRDVRGARTITIVLITCGVGTIAYFQANLTALLVEGAIGQAFRSNRMRKTIAGIKNHMVVAGCGSTGRHVIEELVATRTPFVAIDRDLHHLERISQDLCEGKMLYVHGDATEDHMLIEAGVRRARGVVAALTHDKDNLFVTLSARSLNAGARIVAKVVEAETAPKMIKAGATTVVNPTMIGGQRIASDLIRPEVNEFLDQMLRDKDRNLRLEEVLIPEGSSFVGMALKDTPIRRETKALVVAVRAADRNFVYNPDPEFVIDRGTTLIVMGETDSIVKLRGMIDDGSVARVAASS